MRLYLIRHGQSLNNVIWAETGTDKGRVFDPPLTDKGWQQIECVAEFMRDELGTRLPLTGLDHDAKRPTVIYTSLMTRAVDTGRAVARALNVPLVALVDAHETGGLFLDDEESGERRGIGGPNRAHFETHYPELELPHHLGEAGWWNRPFEPQELRADRARAVWQDLVERHAKPDDVIGLITHGGFYNHLLAILLGLPGREDVWFTLNNCAVSRIDLTERGLAFIYLNRIEHLPSELITL
jgi:2,3-bisphosphoglycerate-dependent phosphoglycerate mutase